MTNNYVEEVCVLHFVYLLYLYIKNLILYLNQMIRNTSYLINTNNHTIIVFTLEKIYKEVRLDDKTKINSGI